jgi:hypothetical protein
LVEEEEEEEEPDEEMHGFSQTNLDTSVGQ